MRSLSIIVAVGQNGAIGRAGGLPWDWPEDRAHFEATTAGHAVIMGRHTFNESGHALAGRPTVVVSSTLQAPADVIVVPTLEAAIERAYALDPEPFVLGGTRIFEEALPRVTTVYLTEIPESPEADAFFVFDRSPFVEQDERRTASGLRFVTLRRRAG